MLSRRECLQRGGQVGTEQEEGPSEGNTQDGICGAGTVPTLALDAPGTHALFPSVRLQLRPLCGSLTAAESDLHRAP